MNTIPFISIPFISYLIAMILISEHVQLVIGKKIRGVTYDFLMASIVISPLLAGVLVYGESPSTFGISPSELSAALGICFGLISIPIQYFWLDVKLIMSGEVLRLFPKLELGVLLRRLLAFLLLFPVSEEILYRGCIQSVLMAYFGSISVGVSSLLFIAPHFVNPGIRYHYSSRKNQFFLLYEGLVLGIISYVSSSLVGCIIAHILMNIPDALTRIRKYLYFNDS